MKHKTMRELDLYTEEKGQKNRNKLGYKRAGKELQENTQITMQNSTTGPGQQSYHPHSDISTAHTLRNPVIHAELSSASLSITSPSARITEFNYNSNIPDSYYAKVYLPNATLTGYKNGSLRTAEGRAFACIHFDPADPRIFDLAGLNAPDPEGHVPGHNNDQEQTRPSATTSTLLPPTTTHPASNPTNANPRPASTGPSGGTCTPPTTDHHAATTSTVSRSIEPHDTTTAAIYHVTTAALPAQPPNTTYPPLPTFLWNNSKHAYDELFTFGSTRAQKEDLVTTNDTNRDQYTPAEWLFLAQVQDYGRGNEDLRRGITIPEELCAGQYLEGLGEERRVSLRFPVLESLFSRAARTWPTSVFKVFAPRHIPLAHNDHGNPQLPTPESSTDDDSVPSLYTDSSSPRDLNDASQDTSDIEWTYPLTPPPLPSIEVPRILIQPLPTVPENPELELPALNLPLRQFEDLQVDSKQTSELGKEFALDDGEDSIYNK